MRDPSIYIQGPGVCVLCFYFYIYIYINPVPVVTPPLFLRFSFLVQ